MNLAELWRTKSSSNVQGEHALCHALDGRFCEQTEEPKEEKARQDLQKNVQFD